jgi:hypothetical protein
MKILLSILASLLILPATAAAALPAPSEVTLQNVSDGVEVSWTAVEGASAYTLYWSGTEDSIIASSGYFEDYLRTDSNATTQVLPADFLTGYDVLHVAVLTLDSEGSESANFTSEATITVGAAGNGTPAAINEPAALPAENNQEPFGPELPAQQAEASVATLQLNEIVVISNTQLNALFSEAIDAASLADAVMSIKSKDAPLKIIDASAIGNVLLVNTAPQVEDEVYRLAVESGLMSEAGGTINGNTTVLFQGVGGSVDDLEVEEVIAPNKDEETSDTSATPATSDSSSSDSSAPEADVESITLETKILDPQSLFPSLLIKWPQSNDDVTAVVISHSKNNGASFHARDPLAVDVGQVAIKLSPGETTIRVEMLTTDDEVVASSTFTQLVSLPQEITASLHGVVATSPLTATVSNQQQMAASQTANVNNSTALNNSGPSTMLWFLMLSGAIAGIITVRRFVRAS